MAEGAAALPPPVATVLAALRAGLDAALPGALLGMYVYGSVALGAYVHGSSDVDFLAVAARELATPDVAALERVHAAVAAAHPAPEPPLMGGYVRREDLGRSGDGFAALATRRPDGRLEAGGRGDINPVTWWVLQRHGIRAWGAALPPHPACTPEQLCAYVRQNMNSYWLGWVQRLEAALRAPAVPEGDPAEEERRLDSAVSWCILGMLRQYYTLREHDVISKAGAGAYGLLHAPDRWHPLIREAVVLQRREAVPARAPRAERLRELVGLLRWIHEACTGDRAPTGT